MTGYAIGTCAGCDKRIYADDELIEVGEHDGEPVFAHAECADLVDEKIWEARP